MPTFKISHIGREKLSTYHRVNKETLLEDPTLKEFEPKDVETLLRVTQYNFRDNPNFKLRKRGEASLEEETKEPLELTPLNEILENVSKDEILRKKKKRPTTSTETTTPVYTKPAPIANPSHYFGHNAPKTKNAIHVTLYNKGYERDLM